MKKRGGEKKYLDILSYEQRIEILKKEIKLYQELIPLKNYFNVVKNQQYPHIVELRKCVALDLIEKGLSYKEIGRVFNRNHATVMHLLKIENHKEIQDEVKENYKKWIKNKTYPVSYCFMVPGYFNSTGFKSTVEYKLAKTIEEIRKIRSKRIYLKKEL